MELIQRTINVKNLSDEIQIVAMGCVHHGAAGCDEKLADFWYDRILKNPNTYVILGGDLVDSIHEKDKRFLLDEVAPWCFDSKWGGTLMDRQYHYGLAKWKPLAEAGKILWVHAGNHEHKLKTSASRDLTSDWVRALSDYADAKKADGPVNAMLSALSTLTVTDGKRAYKVRFFTQHGGGGSQTDGGVINKATSMLQGHNVDVALMWHLHRRVHAQKDQFEQNDAGQKVVRSRIAAVCGTFLDGHVEGVSSYAELKGYLPTPLGPAVVHLKQDIIPATKKEKGMKLPATKYVTRIYVTEAAKSPAEE